MEPIKLNGGQRVDIVGEGSYQGNLEAICGGKCEDGHDFPVSVELRPEPENPYDPRAVAGYANGAKVGYLQKPQAAQYQPILLDLQRRNLYAWVPGRIIGGWDRGGDDVGHFGIWLDLAPPKRCVPS